MNLGWIQLQIQLFWSNFCADVGPQKLEIFTSLSVYSILLGLGKVKVPYQHESDRDGDMSTYRLCLPNPSRRGDRFLRKQLISTIIGEFR